MSKLKQVILLLVLVALFFCFFAFYFSKTLDTSKTPYYAVFLTNGQVYFGHISKLDATQIQLVDVYYLRTNTNLTDQALQEKKQQTDLHLTLIKLGQEIHGPTDHIFMNRQQVLFWEELRDDGEVVQAIKRHQ